MIAPASVLFALPEGPGEPGPAEPFPLTGRAARSWPPLGLALGVGLLALLVRLPFLTSIPPTWDSVQYVLGVLHYDLELHQPHPPGYILYVCAAKALHALGLSPYAALLALSLVAGAAMAALLSWWAARLGGTAAALAAGGLTIASPLAWNYATVGDTYALSGCLSAVVGYLCWRLYREEAQSPLPPAAALGLAGGLRPTDALFLLPLWLYCIGKRGWKATLIGSVTFGLVSLAWFLPLLAIVGGLGRYLDLSHRLGRGVWEISPLAGGAARLSHYLGALGVGALGLLFVGWLFVPAAGQTDLGRARGFLLLWLAPATIFYVVVHLGTPGYMMILAPPLLLLAGLGLGRVLQAGPAARGLALFAVVLALNGFFLHQTILKAQQAQAAHFQEIVAACRPYAGPETVVLTTPGRTGRPHAELPYRAAMYLLPDCRVFLFPLVEPGAPGGLPNAGYRMQSAIERPPLRLRGLRHLLVGPSHLRYLPPGADFRQVVANPQAEIFLVEVQGAEVVLDQAGISFLWNAPAGRPGGSESDGTRSDSGRVPATD